jgi:AAA+ ATPase superfamily predicted ATPase
MANPSAAPSPFQFHKWVTGASFCNRHKDIEAIKTNIRNGNNVLLYSHRRFGKSSLIHQVFSELAAEKSRTRTLYCDLYGTITERDFLVKLYRSLNQIESNLKKLISFFKSVRLTFSVDPQSAAPTVTPIFESATPEIVFDELMDAIKELSKAGSIAIAFDEFQEVASYATNKDGSFEKKLRSHIQGHLKVSYLFAGSQRHILSSMFSTRSRALYNLANSLSLSGISEEELTPWVIGHFSKIRLSLPPEFVGHVVRHFECHPMYVQQFFSIFWDYVHQPDFKFPPGDFIALVNQIELDMIDAKRIDFETMWDRLTQSQRATCKLILLTDGINLFQSRNLAQAELSAPATVERALAKLVDLEILYKNDRYAFYDMLFRKWLQKKLAY